MLSPGGSFGSYEVLRRLAVGGMGEVYLCRHRLLDRLDAVKVLRPHLAGQPDFRRRFLREALSVAHLRHPGVVTVYTADEADGLLYLAMEYVPGEDLASILERGLLAPGRVVRLLSIVAGALDTAHRANLVHRDIKPSNLLVTGAGTPEESVTLVDFGISRRIDADPDITRTGEVVGTIAYCAPEQLSSAHVDGGCDQYALACVAYECLTGRVPFPRESQLSMVTAHLTAPPPLLTAARPDLPPAVDVVIARAMAKSPAARYPSCGAFVAALADALAPALSWELDQAAAGAEPDPGPTELLSRLARGEVTAPHRPGGAGWLAPRVGRGAHGPVVVPLARGPVAVRADAAPSATVTAWLIAQAVARHSSRDLCLVAALAPTADENWLWVGWLPHARPSTPPIAGPHLATTAEAAADLVGRLAALIRERAAAGAGPGAGPSVLAVLDSRLGAGLAGDPRLGVHVVRLEPSAAPVPPGVAALDVSADLQQLRWTPPGRPPTDGVPDAPPPGYGRDIGELLPDE